MVCPVFGVFFRAVQVEISLTLTGAFGNTHPQRWGKRPAFLLLCPPDLIYFNIE